MLDVSRELLSDLETSRRGHHPAACANRHRGWLPLPGRRLRRSIPPGGGLLALRLSIRTWSEAGNASRKSRSSLNAVSSLRFVLASPLLLERLDARKSARSSLRTSLVCRHHKNAMVAAIAAPMPIWSSGDNVAKDAAAEQGAAAHSRPARSWSQTFLPVTVRRRVPPSHSSQSSAK